MTTVTIDLDEKSNQSLQTLAAGYNQSPTALLQRAVEQFLADEMLQEQFRRETIAALEEYERTGLHVTGDEAEEWLLRLEAGESVDPPICHT